MLISRIRTFPSTLIASALPTYRPMKNIFTEERGMWYNDFPKLLGLIFLRKSVFFEVPRWPESARCDPPPSCRTEGRPGPQSICDRPGPAHRNTGAATVWVSGVPAGVRAEGELEAGPRRETSGDTGPVQTPEAFSLSRIIQNASVPSRDWKVAAGPRVG